MTTNDDPVPIERRLADALRTTARADAELGASSGVRARLLADVRARRKAHYRRQLAWIAAAAAIVIAVAAARWQVADSTSSSEPDATVTTGAAAPDGVPTDFLPLRYVNVPARSGHIVQMVVPAAVMASFGLEPSSATGDVVTVDVYVGDDGLARAVHFDSLTTRELAK